MAAPLPAPRPPAGQRLSGVFSVPPPPTPVPLELDLQGLGSPSHVAEPVERPVRADSTAERSSEPVLAQETDESRPTLIDAPPEADPNDSGLIETAEEVDIPETPHEPRVEPERAALVLESLSVPSESETDATQPALDGNLAETKATEADDPEVTIESPVSEHLASVSEPSASEPPVSELPVSEPPVSEPPVSEPPVSELPVSELPVSEPPVSLPGEAAADEPLERAAAAQSDLPPPHETTPSRPTSWPGPADVSLPPGPPTSSPVSWGSRVAATRKQIAGAVPPRWVAIARQHPALWLVAAPVLLASLLILIVASSGPARQPERAPRPPLANAVSAAVPATTEPASAPPPASTNGAPDTQVVAGLEGKDPASLGAKELLLLNDTRAQRKRADAKALSQKLQAQPELVKDVAVQAQLLHLAIDPDTAADALTAMTQAQAPIGPDLLYEVWMSRSAAPGTADLARSLLYSHDVRPGASPALAVALDLRRADCEGVQAVLPKVQTDGDTRSIAPLIKLTFRHGCGAAKRDDCYPCLRSGNKQLVATTRAAGSRHAPSYPSVKTK